MRQRFFLGLSPAGFHRVAYWEHGPGQAAQTVVCVHGLTRNGRDFDALAGSLVGLGRRVACPDVVGRGASDWLADPAHYALPQYCADMAALVARLDVGTVDWVGTSMGGLIGMLLAAMPGTPIRRLVLNDVGPFVPGPGLAAIAAGLEDRAFDDLEALEAHLRQVAAGFGPLTDAQWRHLTEHGWRRLPDGRLARNHDPAIAAPLRAAPPADVDLWPVYDAVGCPVLVIRGAESAVLTAETAADMAARGPKAEVVTLPGIGHAPALMADDQIALVRDFLDG